VRISRPRQSATLQLRHQPVAHLHDVAPVKCPVEEQKAVTADFLHNLLHHAGDVVDRAGEIDAGLGGLADGYFPRRLADPFGQR
jgi:hypothetical protein